MAPALTSAPVMTSSAPHGCGQALRAGMRRVDERATAQVEPLQVGRRVAAVEARQRARVTLADQQPVRMEALELPRVVDGGDRNDRARAARERVRGDRERAEDVDDDRQAAGALRARDEVDYVSTASSVASQSRTRVQPAADPLGSLALQSTTRLRVARAARS